MLEELDGLVLSLRKREEEVNKQNQMLKLRLDKAFNALEDQMAENETQKAKYERLLIEKDSSLHNQEQELKKKVLKDAQTKKNAAKGDIVEVKGKENKAVQSIMVIEEPPKDHVNADSIQTIFDGQQYMKTQLENTQQEVLHWKEAVARVADKLKD